MANPRGSAGLGLVELLVAVACFALALVPLFALYSTSIDSVNVIQARSLACVAAQELMGQAVLMPPERLPIGLYDFSAGTEAARPSFATSWRLSALPKEFTRRLIIADPGLGDPDARRIQVTIQHATIPQVLMTWYRTAVPGTVPES